MRKVLLIIFLVFIFYLIEILLFNLFGRWFRPNLLLLLIIFFDFYLGIRFGLLTAFAAGILRDSFSTHILGVNLLSLVASAFLTTVFRKQFYFKGSRTSFFLVISLVCLANFLIQFVLYIFCSTVNFSSALTAVFFPQIISTLLVSLFVFKQLRKCVSRLFV